MLHAITFALLVSLPAHAGKLADDNGFRGVQFGPASVLEKAPMEGCRAGGNGFRWVCETRIGEHPVSVFYSTKHGLFYHVLISSPAAHASQCAPLRNVLTAAWGDPDATSSKDWTSWSDGDVAANLVFTHECTISISNRKVRAELEQREKAAAAEAVKDL